MQCLATICPAQSTLRWPFIWGQLKCPGKLTERLIISPRIKVVETKQALGHCQRIQAEGSVKLGIRLLVVPHHGEVQAEEMMPRRVSRINFKRPFKFPFSR